MSKEEFKKVETLNKSEGKMMHEVTSEEKLEPKDQETIEGGAKESIKNESFEDTSCNFCSPII